MLAVLPGPRLEADVLGREAGRQRRRAERVLAVMSHPLVAALVAAVAAGRDAGVDLRGGRHRRREQRAGHRLGRVAAASRPAGIEPRWQVSQVVADGMCAFAPDRRRRRHHDDAW